MCDTPAAILRNWLTFVLRACIQDQERVAYYNQTGLINEVTIRKIFNARIKKETNQSLLIHTVNGRLDLFEKYFTVNHALVVPGPQHQWLVSTVFP